MNLTASEYLGMIDEIAMLRMENERYEQQNRILAQTVYQQSLMIKQFPQHSHPNQYSHNLTHLTEPPSEMDSFHLESSPLNLRNQIPLSSLIGVPSHDYPNTAKTLQNLTQQTQNKSSFILDHCKSQPSFNGFFHKGNNRNQTQIQMIQNQKEFNPIKNGKQARRVQMLRDLYSKNTIFAEKNEGNKKSQSKKSNGNGTRLSIVSKSSKSSNGKKGKKSISKIDSCGSLASTGSKFKKTTSGLKKQSNSSKNIKFPSKNPNFRQQIQNGI